MPIPYLCPMCRRNRSTFALSWTVSLEIRKHPDDGGWVWQADTIELASQADRPDVKVKCLECDYEAREAVFAKAAKRAAADKSPVAAEKQLSAATNMRPNAPLKKGVAVKKRSAAERTRSSRSIRFSG